MAAQTRRRRLRGTFSVASAALAFAAMTTATAFQFAPPLHAGWRPRALGASVETPSPPLQLSVSTSAPASHVLSLEQMGPMVKFSKGGKLKVLNLVGLHHLLVIAVTMPLWMAAMEALRRLGDSIPDFDPERAKFDYSGKLWCRAYLRLTGCYPEIAGDVSRLDSGDGACLFVANHASFLDIAVLCCVLDGVFKFIAKESLRDFPGVGTQLVGGEHVLIDRADKRSQLKAFRRAVAYLRRGTPIMAFPEGARSPDGRLMPFKGGIFSMAAKAGVPIVPLSLSNTHAVMPGNGLLPVQGGGGKLRVYVHGAIGVKGKEEAEIAREVRAALLSELPWDQHPLHEDEEVEDLSSGRARLCERDGCHEAVDARQSTC